MGGKSDKWAVGASRKKPKPLKVRSPGNPEVGAMLRRAGVHATVAVFLAGFCVVFFHETRRWVERRVVFPTAPPQAVLLNRPAWMSDFLYGEILATAQPTGTHSAMDHQLLVDVTEMLRANPWISRVNQVRRAYGQKPGDTLEIDCEYHTPLALVHWMDYYWLVSGDGYKLPEQFTAKQVPKIALGRDKHTNIRIIDGVKEPPPETGMHWGGEDLAAGLDMAKILYGQGFADEVVKIDVVNFQRRVNPKDAQIVLVTKYGTQLLWGRPVKAEDYFVEVSTAQKLDNMKRVYEQYRRVDGQRRWLDLRFDKVTYPSDPVEAQPANTRTARGAGKR